VPSNGTKVHVITYGCAQNKADGEIIRGILAEHGFKIVDSESEADIIVVNTCGVKVPTEFKVLNKLRKLSSTGKPVIVAGCLPKINLEGIIKSIPNFAAIVGPFSYQRIHEIARRIVEGERGIIDIKSDKMVKVCTPRLRENKVVGIVPICEGCLGSCTYCAVRLARGRLFSFPPDAIVREVERFVREGCREIWITAQDTIAYGADIGTSLPELLSKIVEVPGKFRIRIGMMNPGRLLNYLDEMLEVYQHPKVYKFIHIPVQSGNDEILRRMNRPYTVDEFRQIVKEIRRKIPEMTIETDVIVGFPGETEEQFMDTVELVKELEPDIVNISRFGPRPNTPAAKMKPQVPGWKIKERSRLMTKVVKEISYRRNQRWVGWRGEVLVSGIGIKGGVVSRNYTYKPIVLQLGEEYLGYEFEIRITRADTFYLDAEVISTIRPL